MIADLMLLFFIFSGVLYLEAQMPYLAMLQLLLILAGIVSAFVLVYSRISKKDWGVAFATIFYSFVLADLLFLAFMTRNFLMFLVVSLFAVAGILKSVLTVKQPEIIGIGSQKNLEIYDAPEAPTRVDATPLIVNSTKNANGITKSGRTTKI